jgi:hypothetical protein
VIGYVPAAACPDHWNVKGSEDIGQFSSTTEGVDVGMFDEKQNVT